MTYSKHSDIYHPYGECLELKNANSAEIDGEIDNIISQKSQTKLAVWMVSNCQSGSLRESYVRDLSAFIFVGIYGRCVGIKLPDKAVSEVIQTYKFFLTFENRLCGEYVTEKLWRSLEFNTVPIVYGGLEYYQYLLTKGSYIDVKDFSSPED